MRQVAQNFKTGLVTVEDVPAPRLQPGCVVVRNEWSLVSAGTERSKIDLGRKSMIGKAQARPDLVRQVLDKVRTEGIASTVATVRTKLDSLSPLGYSCAGEVQAVAADVRGFEVGDRVACAGAEHAFHAGVVCVPQNLCAHIPEAVTTEQAAYTTLGCVAMQGVRQADVTLGDRVLVVGLGLLGQLAVQMLKAAGCSVAGADVGARQIELSRVSGCDLAVEASDPGAAGHLMEFTAGSGFDAVVITAASDSNAPFLLAGEVARDRARIVLVGVVPIDIPRSPYYEKDLSVHLSRSYGPGRYDPSYELHGHDYPIGYVRWTEQRNMEGFLELLRTGAVKVEHLTTHRFDIERASEAYDLLATGSEPYMGLLLRYPSEEAKRHEQAVNPAGGTGRRGMILVGAGNFASRVLIPGIKAAGILGLDAVVSAHGLSAVDAARKFGFAAAESDPALAFGRPGVGAAVIATRHDSHAELVLEALRAGLDVFVEKPLCLRSDELPAIVAAQQDAGRLCMVGFNRRFAPTTAELRDLRLRHPGPAQILIRVNAGAIPRESWIQDSRIGGGRIVGEVCHFLDLAIYLSGSRVARVSAAGCTGAEISPELQDSLSVLLAHSDGSVSTIVYTAQGDTRLPKERIELFAGGEAGVIEDFRETALYARGRVSRVRSRGQDKGHRAELAAFSRAVADGSEVELVSFEDCVHSTMVTFAVVEALRTGSAIDMTEYAESVLGSERA